MTTNTSGTPYVATSGTQKKLVPTIKAYKDEEFLNSHAARQIRIMCEFEEPAKRLSENGVLGTILFFGSARSMSPEDYAATTSSIKAQLTTLTKPEERKPLEDKLKKLEKTEWMTRSYGKVQELARRLTEWSTNNPKLVDKLKENPPMYLRDYCMSESNLQPLMVCTGGGPGFMEAANRGASQVPNALSMGMAISLPFEKGVNEYVTPKLAFEFHYFFTRKFWMMYSAKALVIGPGGYGTFDELFEMLTLKQTGKVRKIPIVLFDTAYWRTVINWQAMVDLGTISQEDVDEMCFTDDVEVAFQFITNIIEDHHTGITPKSMQPPVGANDEMWSPKRSK
eukprot:PhF_6_TR37565/c0_g3_i1/m.55664/K06966/K06966; uncharacterized protein